MTCRVYQYLSAVFVCLGLISCGGGGASSADAVGTRAGTLGLLEQGSFNVGQVTTSGSQISVASISLVSKTHIDATVWQYVYQVSVKNTGGAVSNATVRL